MRLFEAVLDFICGAYCIHNVTEKLELKTKRGMCGDKVIIENLRYHKKPRYRTANQIFKHTLLGCTQ